MMNIPIAYNFVAIICLLTTSKVVNGAIGLTWGRQSIQRLVPAMVVDLILQNGVRDARIYSTQPDLLNAFSGSGINLNLGIYNVSLLRTDEQAFAWVQKKIVPNYVRATIRRVFIGNYVFKSGVIYESIRNDAIRTLDVVQNALNKAGYGDVKAALTYAPDFVLKDNITRPSEAEFKTDLMNDMNRALNILKTNNCPFVIQVFPALYVLNNSMPTIFAFPDNNDSSSFIKDVNGTVYTNAFDFIFDSFVWALEKAGAGDLEVVVDQLCWPTDGFPGGNSSSAERFYRVLLPRVASNRGTPKRPGKPIDVFVHSLSDETRMPITHPWSRHWGIYRSNGEPKYKIDLMGQGRDIFPVRAKGIMRMPERWCVFKNNTHDANMLDKQTQKACAFADCTCLGLGGSCSRLTFEESVSYRFNMYFQSKFQEEGTCDFDGLAEVVTQNPSTGECLFPVEVVKGNQNLFDKQYGSGAYHGKGLNGIGDRCAVWFVILISVLWAVF